MLKKSLASLEIAALVHEMQFLVRGKLSQIYHQDKGEFLLQLHAIGKGKRLLKVIPGKLLCITEKKETLLKPSGFCMLLRKYAANTVIKSMYQKDAERIIVLELEKEQKLYFIIELFSKGNVVLTDEEFKIIAALEQHVWKDRTVKVGEKYIFPSALNWKESTLQQLKTILKKSEKKNVATALATEVGLGGVYAQELCLRAAVATEKLPQEVTAKEVELLLQGLKEMLALSTAPQGFIYEEEITPFPLIGREVQRQTTTYSEALDTLNPFKIVSPYVKKIQSLQHMIGEQEEAIQQLQEKIKLQTRKAELMYEHYLPLAKLLQIVQELRKEKEWKDIEKELRKEKRITHVDLKNKHVVIEL